MKKMRTITTIILILIYASFSVNAQGDVYSKNVWSDQYKLEIYFLQNKTFILGQEEAKISIGIKNKKTNSLEIAQYNTTVFLSSDKSILDPSKIIILKGEAKSDDVSLSPVQPGIVTIKAESVGFDAVTALLEFVPQPNPSELNLTAHPTEKLMADGKDSTKLMVKLMYPDGRLFMPQADKSIFISTNLGDFQQLNISRLEPYVQTQFRTYKPGIVEIIAASPDYNLEGHVKVSFVSPITLLTALLALLGGFIGGIVKYYQENKKGIGFFPKLQKDGKWRLSMLGTAIFHGIFGYIVYLGASLNMPFTNVFDLPVDIGNGALLLGFTGGVFFFTLISIWGILYKQLGGKIIDQ